MKKFFIALVSVLSFLVLPATVFGATTSGPVGRNALRVYPGPGIGQVTLEWRRFFTDGENFTLHYGTTSNVYPYAAPYVGYVSTYTIGNLKPGTQYFFAVEGIRAGNVSAGWDGEVSAVAPSSPVTVLGTAGPVGRNLLWAKAGSKAGDVTLSWTRFYPDSEGWSIVYGNLPGQYVYGALNAVNAVGVVNSNFSYTVHSLQSGKRYYFAIVPSRGGTSLYVTPEVSFVAP